MIIYEDIFNTRLGTDFKFAFDFNNGSFDIHILEQPAYGNRSEDLHLTHRICTDGAFKICWAGELRNLGEAKQVAANWALLTEKYILTGTPFPS